MYRSKVHKKTLHPCFNHDGPHDSKKDYNIKVPTIGIGISILLWMVGSLFVVSFAIDALNTKNEDCDELLCCTVH